MISKKHLIIPITFLSLAVSSPAMSKKPEEQGRPRENGNDAHWINSNKQLDEFSQRGRKRAEKRHELKRYKDYKKKFKEKKHKSRDEFHDSHGDHDGLMQRRFDNLEDRYRRQYEAERDSMDPRNDQRYHEYKKQRDRDHQRYENDQLLQKPVETIIDRNVENVKTKIDAMHRRTIDVIDDKTREFTGVDSRNKDLRQQKKDSESGSWWWPFAD